MSGPNTPSIFVGIPCYGGWIAVETMMSVFDAVVALGKHQIRVHLHGQSGESLIPRGRNSITHKFLHESQCSHLLFVDADLQFPPEAIVALALSGYDVVGVPYPRKHVDFDLLRAAVAHETATGVRLDLAKLCGDLVLDKLEGAAEAGDGFVEVASIGAGLLLIKREVFVAMAERYPEIAYREDVPVPGDRVCDFWFTGIAQEPGYGPRYLSEDYGFCRRWRDMGGKIHAYLNASVTHWGRFGFQGISREVRIDPATGERFALLPVGGAGETRP